MTNSFVSEAFGLGLSPIELYKQKSVTPSNIIVPAANLQSDRSERISDANIWLPYAAREYELSTNIRDYVMIPVPVLFSAIPNTNGDSVSLAELLRFNPEHGQQSYKMWKGQPTFIEHDNKNHKRAKGVILDAFLRPLRGFGQNKYHKVVLLLAYDRTKDPLLVNSILTGQNNAYSIGFYFGEYACSICGTVVGQNSGVPCTHTMPRKRTYVDEQNRLVYRKCRYIKPFECSSVANPAFITAISPHVMDPMSM